MQSLRLGHVPPEKEEEEEKNVIHLKE